MTALTRRQRSEALAAAMLLIAGTTYLTINFSIAPLFIVGIPGILAYLLWYATGLRRPLDPVAIVPVFLLATAGFTLSSIEEYLGHYGPAVGRLFGFAWTDQAFAVITLALVGALGVVAVGLYHRVTMAAFVASLFLATRVAELALFAFPLIRPAIQPETPGPVSQIIDGVLVPNMPNHDLHVVGNYYFPGMFTVVLPLVPAVYALYRIWGTRPSQLTHQEPAATGRAA